MHVVDLVRAGVVQLVALEVDLRAAEPLGQPLGEVERARAADVVLPADRPTRPGRSGSVLAALVLAPRGRGSAASASRRRSGRRSRRNGRARRARCGRSSAACVVHRRRLRVAAGLLQPRAPRRRVAGRRQASSAARPSRARRDEGRDPRRVLVARAGSRPRRRRRPGSAPVRRTASATLSGVRPPASIHGRFHCRAADAAASRRRARCRRAGRRRAAAGVDRGAGRRPRQ